MKRKQKNLFQIHFNQGDVFMCNGGCGFEGNGCWWIIILVILFIFLCGCGNSNCGCDNGCNSGCGCGC